MPEPCVMLEVDHRFWKAAVKCALARQEIGPDKPCPVCDGTHMDTYAGMVKREKARTKYLQVCRADPNGPSKEDVSLVCLWIMSNGWDVPKFWKFWSEVPPTTEDDVRADRIAQDAEVARRIKDGDAE